MSSIKFQIFTKLIFSISIAFGAFSASAGTDIGNGGDLIRCVPYAGNDLNGLYSLDYLIFATEAGPKAADAQSWEESIFRIRRLFVDKLPELLPVFDDFANNILNEDQSRRQVWEPTDYELTELSDEELPASVKIPVNCRESGKLQLVQAVIRQNPTFTGSKLIVYKYMPKMFEKMAKERPLQLSFLLVHEFLWSISDNVDRNRRINWFLHSEEIQSLSRLQVIDRLLGMGLDVKEVPRILDSKGRGHFTTLQDALAQAREGETIVVKEGTYSTGGASVVVPIKLVGEGDRDKIVVKGTKVYPAFDVALEKGQLLTLENMTISRFSQPAFRSHETADTISLTSGGISLNNVTLRGDAAYQLSLLGDRTGIFDHVTFEGYSGIYVGLEKGKLHIKNSVFKTTGHGMRMYYGVTGDMFFKGNRFYPACAVVLDAPHTDSKERERRTAILRSYLEKQFIDNEYPGVTETTQKIFWCNP